MIYCFRDKNAHSWLWKAELWNINLDSNPVLFPFLKVLHQHRVCDYVNPIDFLVLLSRQSVELCFCNLLVCFETAKGSL